MSTPDESTVWRHWRERQEENARLRRQIEQVEDTILLLQRNVASRSSQVSRIRARLNDPFVSHEERARNIREIVEER